MTEEDRAKAKSNGPMIGKIDAFVDLLVGSREIERQLIAVLSRLRRWNRSQWAALALASVRLDRHREVEALGGV